MRKVLHGHAVRAGGQRDHAARMTHQHRGRRIFIRRPQFFDDHAIGTRRDHDLDHRSVQLRQALFERQVRARLQSRQPPAPTSMTP